MMGKCALCQQGNLSTDPSSNTKASGVTGVSDSRAKGWWGRQRDRMVTRLTNQQAWWDRSKEKRKKAKFSEGP